MESAKTAKPFHQLTISKNGLMVAGPDQTGVSPRELRRLPIFHNKTPETQVYHLKTPVFWKDSHPSSWMVNNFLTKINLIHSLLTLMPLQDLAVFPRWVKLMVSHLEQQLQVLSWEVNQLLKSTSSLENSNLLHRFHLSNLQVVIKDLTLLNH